MKKISILLFLLFTIYACAPKQDDSNDNTQPVVEAEVTTYPSGLKNSLVQKKATIDSIFQLELQDTILTLSRKQFQVWVKLPSRGFVQVFNNWPEEIESTFNLLFDNQGRLVRVSEMPFSESGDWDMMFSHYFTAEGKTFAFEKEVSAFNTSCPNDEYLEGVTREKIIQIYSPSFTMIDSTYKMTDEAGKDITKRKCQLEVESDVKVFKDLPTYLTGNKLNFN
ncbi:hypothetical protein [Rufibacter sp. LB8]|uniref:hypothetical protein n=1 Tax=Rufibacter sp. LB8 TaxID=2777781 RepID=UPI00178C4202|nr:hypothetical protein [Rufibacter sp. LB8]